MAASKRPSAEGRAPLARHGALKSRHPFVTLFAMLGVALGVFGVSAAGIAAYNVWDATQTVAANAVVLDGDEPLPPSLGAIEGGVNILMAGTDSCEGENAQLSSACRALALGAYLSGPPVKKWNTVRSGTPSSASTRNVSSHASRVWITSASPSR